MSAKQKRTPAVTAAAVTKRYGPNELPEDTLRVWTSPTREVSAELGFGPESNHADFVSASVHRPSADILRIEIRSSHDAPQDEHWGKFYVPIALAPYLGAYFTELVRRASEEGLLRPAAGWDGDQQTHPVEQL